MRHVLIVGATSAIAEACARRFATRGDRLFLVARDRIALESIQTDLSIRHPDCIAGIARWDVNEGAMRSDVLGMAWTKLGGIDIALIAHGTLPNPSECESSADIALREFATNAGATIALLTELALRMRATPGATIAAISSVAGDRGRASNYLYGSAKAAVSAFLSGLRQRLHADGVNVLTIKPGFVDTPMTHAFRKSPLWATPDQIAHGIVRAIDRRSSVVYLPWFWAAIMFAIKRIPEPIFKRMRL
jgi:short-subunit dehydrogenase